MFCQEFTCVSLITYVILSYFYHSVNKNKGPVLATLYTSENKGWRWGVSVYSHK